MAVGKSRYGIRLYFCGSMRMYRESNITRKRKALGVMLISEESQAWLQARLQSDEGKRCLDQFATLVIDWAIAQMPTDLLEALVKEKGHATLKEIWPDIVDAHFKALSNPGPRK